MARPYGTRKNFKSTFGERLSELLDKTNKTCTEVAKDTGYSIATVSRLQRSVGEPSMAFVVSIARYFNVTSDFLLGIEP